MLKNESQPFCFKGSINLLTVFHQVNIIGSGGIFGGGNQIELMATNEKYSTLYLDEMK
ncbi:hypothetical protein LZT47_15995 [Enterococcus avium]|uniref:hypothetical protein n=1 Tax=Enterococcus TaxID=1350 RepID=UPI0009203902|nr:MULTISPECIES: hypothetical protein [Enterococcus]MBX9123158.1 hypothetical protein [Enterococcus sp. K18_3]MDD9143361.1 hypothetical protein [Enterococcus avium]MDT2409384.1 hypothetical protein [Enterococcus avium]MDT2413984.1 hypothetical protein [Enterococcus avium]MDT2444264.1 hypothetical protein [Enterococcus avium]